MYYCLIWKKKGSALDLNQMRYIHTKLWDAKLCEALVTRNMKGKIVKACPNIQIGGMPNSSSVEHLVTLKTRPSESSHIRKSLWRPHCCPEATC